MDLDLTPVVCQTVSRLLKNRHPRSVSDIQSMNSLYMWTNQTPGHMYQFHNSLGDSYRYIVLCKILSKPQEVALMDGFVCWSVGLYVFKKILKSLKIGFVNII